MRFYNRTEELSSLKDNLVIAKNQSRFTLVVGRRRVGKTALLMEALKHERFLYLFVARKTQALLCETFQNDAQATLGIKIHGRIDRFRDLFSELLSFSEKEPFTLVIDEFQDFERVDKALFSEIQEVWDRQKEAARINLIVSGSIYSLMVKIFEDSKEPLFGRATARLHIQPFSLQTIKEVLGEHNPHYSPDDLLCLYMLTGGVPKYIASLMDAGAKTKDEMLRTVFSEGSPFLTDGRDVLISEFGADYSTYFSILQLIAQGKTSQSAIDSVIGKNTGAYLLNLEARYNVISKIRPIFAKPETRGTRWVIDDHFLRFWFGFIYANQSLVEAKRYDLLLEIAANRYADYSGLILEDYFRRKLAEEGRFTEVGRSWDNKGLCEIDIVALNALDKRATIAEVKRNPRKLSLAQVEEKAHSIQDQLAKYEVHYAGYSLRDM